MLQKVLKTCYLISKCELTSYGENQNILQLILMDKKLCSLSKFCCGDI